MSQTTGAINSSAAKVEYSNDGGSTWTNISGFANKVEQPEGSRISGEEYTADGDTAIVMAGKREPMEVKVMIVYTEGSSEPFRTVEADFRAGTRAQVRWSPAGGASTQRQYTTSRGPITKLTSPGHDAKGGGPEMCGFTIRTADVTPSTIA